MLPFPKPETDVGADRCKQARSAVRDALDGLISSAVGVGWTVDEITVAVAEAGQAMKSATVVEENLPGDEALSDVAPPPNLR